MNKKKPPGIPDIEYILADLVEDGLITEEQGIAYLDAGYQDTTGLKRFIQGLRSLPDEGE